MARKNWGVLSKLEGTGSGALEVGSICLSLSFIDDGIDCGIRLVL